MQLKVIGAGSVGMSIIEAFAQQGFTVSGIEVNEEIIQRGTARVDKNLSKLVKKGKISEEDKEAVIKKNPDDYRF